MNFTVGVNNAFASFSGLIENSGGPLTLIKTGTGAASPTPATATRAARRSPPALSITADEVLGPARGGVTFSGNGSLQAAGPLTLNSDRSVTIDSGVTGTLDSNGYTLTVSGRNRRRRQPGHHGGGHGRSEQYGQ